MGKVIWSDKEVEVLREMVKVNCTLDEIHEALPKRTKDAIKKKAYSFDLDIKSSSEFEPNWEAYKKYLELRKG